MRHEARAIHPIKMDLHTFLRGESIKTGKRFARFMKMFKGTLEPTTTTQREGERGGGRFVVILRSSRNTRPRIRIITRTWPQSSSFETAVLSIPGGSMCLKNNDFSSSRKIRFSRPLRILSHPYATQHLDDERPAIRTII